MTQFVMSTTVRYPQRWVMSALFYWISYLSTSRPHSDWNPFRNCIIAPFSLRFRLRFFHLHLF